MRKIIYLICIPFVGITMTAQDCDQAFSAANYAVSNSTKAYEGHNIAHIREWTEKALEAFNEVEEITADCGCIQVSDFAYEGYLACDKAQVEETFEQARFFAKRSRDKAKKMMDALSKCTNIPVSDIEARKFAGSEDYSATNVNSFSSAENDLNTQQENLLAQQAKLLEQQQKLQQQIAEQQKQVTALKQQRANELVQQKKIKLNAEIALKEMQKSYAKLATSVGCHEAMKAAKVSITKPMEALENETLTATKIYYTQKLNEIVDMFNKSFSQCSADW